MLLWGSSFIALKLAFQYYDPMFVVFGRMLVASLCFACFFYKFRHNDYQPGDWKILSFMALCEPCMYFLFEAHAVKNTSASQAGMITAMLPLMVAVSARLFLREAITRQTMVGFGLAIVGVCWLSASGAATEDAPRPLLGNFLEFLAMVCATVYTIICKRLSSRYNPFFLTAFQAFVGSVFFLPFILWDTSAIPRTFSAVPVASIFYLGIFITAGAYGLFNYGLSCIPASQVTAFVNLIPVCTVTLGWLVLGETFTPQQYPASVLVLLGVFLSQERKKPSAGARRTTEPRCRPAPVVK